MSPEEIKRWAAVVECAERYDLKGKDGWLHALVQAVDAVPCRPEARPLADVPDDELRDYAAHLRATNEADEAELRRLHAELNALRRSEASPEPRIYGEDGSAPSDAPKCTVCGGTRLVRKGRLDACSFTECPDPSRDYYDENTKDLGYAAKKARGIHAEPHRLGVAVFLPNVWAGDILLTAEEAATLLDALNGVLQQRSAAAQPPEAPTLTAHPRDAWHEIDGPALWWRFPIVEPPYSGTPLDDGFPDYVTHWTPIAIPDGGA